MLSVSSPPCLASCRRCTTCEQKRSSPLPQYIVVTLNPLSLCTGHLLKAVDPATGAPLVLPQLKQEVAALMGAGEMKGGGGVAGAGQAGGRGAGGQAGGQAGR